MNPQEQNQKKQDMPGMPGSSNMPITPGAGSAPGTGSMPGAGSMANAPPGVAHAVQPDPTVPTIQKGGFFLTDDGSLTWTSIIGSILHFILAWFAIYTAYKCGGGFGGYLFACCCPYIYLPYVYFFKDASLCGIRKGVAAAAASGKTINSSSIKAQVGGASASKILRSMRR